MNETRKEKFWCEQDGSWSPKCSCEEQCFECGLVQSNYFEYINGDDPCISFINGELSISGSVVELGNDDEFFGLGLNDEETLDLFNVMKNYYDSLK